MTVEKNYTLDEYIANPLTLDELKAYRLELSKCIKRERDLQRLSVAVSVVLAMMLSALLLYITELSIAHALILGGTSGPALHRLSILVISGVLLLNRCGVSLLIDGEHCIKNTDIRVLAELKVNEESIPKGSKADQLVRAIHAENRSVVAFEKTLLERMLKL